MSKKQFTLDSWLKDKSQKVVTRCGFPVRIVCTDVKRKDYPILALVERDDQEEYQSFTKDGRFSLYNPLHDNFDLFIETADEVSEDEKIRKRLITDFGTIGKKEWGGLEVKDILAWLERQGEHANFRNKIQVGDKVTRNEDGVLVNLSQLKRVAKPREKQAEQKPSEWSEEDEDLLKWSINNLTELKDRFGEKYGKVGKCIDWVKSIQDRVQLQPKQEWSEEDKYMYDILCGTIENTDINENTKYKLISWLKSLRPQNRWEPSEEQIKAIRLAMSFVVDNFGEYSMLSETLMELEEQLKKLKEK